LTWCEDVIHYKDMLWLLGYVGWVMAFWGVYLIGEKNVKGFYINIAANVFLIVDAIMFAHFSVIFAMMIFTTLNVINIWKWQFRNRKQGEQR